MKETGNYSIKGYAMGNYKYEWGTQLPWQKTTARSVKAIGMSNAEMSYWQEYFNKKYDGNFAKIK